MELSLSNQEKNYIIDGIQEKIRNDGRGNTDYRSIFLETDVLSTTNGSAKVQIDSTMVIVGVKAEIKEVEDSSKCINRLKFFVDFSAIASSNFAGKGGNDCGEDMAKILYNAYNYDTAISNINKLIIEKTFMWALYVDIIILRCGGSVLDAISIGVKAALANTKICEVVAQPADEGKIMIDVPDEYNTWTLDVKRAPLIIGVNKIGKQSVIDATEYEEACSSSIVYIAVEPLDHNSFMNKNKDDCRITCIRKHKGGSLELESIEDMLNVAVQTANFLNRAIFNRLEEEQLYKEQRKITALNQDLPLPTIFNPLFR